MSQSADFSRRRPQRADARRNYDALIAAARDTFAELGTLAPLEEIARRAEVGIATLYRNFPTREELIESVYLEEVEAVVQAALTVEHLEPWPALLAWFDRVMAYIGTKKALIDALNRDSPAIQSCRTSLFTAGQPLLARAQAAGVVRNDVGIDDVLRLVTSIAGAGFPSPEQRSKVLSIALDGLLLQRSEQSSSSMDK